MPYRMANSCGLRDTVLVSERREAIGQQDRAWPCAADHRPSAHPRPAGGTTACRNVRRRLISPDTPPTAPLGGALTGGSRIPPAAIRRHPASIRVPAARAMRADLGARTPDRSSVGSTYGELHVDRTKVSRSPARSRPLQIAERSLSRSRPGCVGVTGIWARARRPSFCRARRSSGASPPRHPRRVRFSPSLVRSCRCPARPAPPPRPSRPRDARPA